MYWLDYMANMADINRAESYLRKVNNVKQLSEAVGVAYIIVTSVMAFGGWFLVMLIPYGFYEYSKYALTLAKEDLKRMNSEYFAREFETPED